MTFMQFYFLSRKNIYIVVLCMLSVYFNSFVEQKMSSKYKVLTLLIWQKCMYISAVSLPVLSPLPLFKPQGTIGLISVCQSVHLKRESCIFTKKQLSYVQ